MPQRRLLVAALATLAMVAFGTAPVDAAAPAKKKGPAPLRIVVTNDDGVHAEGIDAIVEGLLDQPKVTVSVVAPAENRTGAGDTTTPGPLTAEETETLSGYDATAVSGFPSDTVIYALDELGLKPHLVISGINEGQNIGFIVDVSGTVGAAKTAVRNGIPALVVSQGLADPPDYAAAVEQAIKWLKQHRTEIAKAKGSGATTLTNLNVPTCLIEEARGVVEVPVATAGDDANAVLQAEAVHCDSTLEDPADDVEAFNNGFVTLTDVPAD